MRLIDLLRLQAQQEEEGMDISQMPVEQLQQVKKSLEAVCDPSSPRSIRRVRA